MISLPVAVFLCTDLSTDDFLGFESLQGQFFWVRILRIHQIMFKDSSTHKSGESAETRFLPKFLNFRRTTALLSFLNMWT